MTKALTGLAELLVKGGSPKTKAQEVLETYTKKNKTKEELQNISDESLSEDEINLKYTVSNKAKRVPEVETAAQELYEGKINKVDYDSIVKQYQPTELITSMIDFPITKRVKAVMGKLGKKVGILNDTLNLKDFVGKRKSARIDIPAMENKNTWVVSLHEGVDKNNNIILNGPVQGYGRAIMLRGSNDGVPVVFTSDEKVALDIARGKRFSKKEGADVKQSKATIGRMNGIVQDFTEEEVYAIAQRELNNPNSEYVQIGMNPFRHSYFYDKKTMEPIISANEVLQVGPLVLGKGITKGKSKDFKFKKGGMVMRNNNYNTQRAI